MLEQDRLLDPGHDRSTAADAPRTAPRRALVVVDDNLHRMIICRTAAKAGYAPAGAATYQEAVKLTQQAAFDCIALDLSLRPQAGDELLRHLHLIGCKASIIIISGRDSGACAESVTLAKSLDLKISDIVTKPVDLAELRRRLDRVKDTRDAVAVA